MDEVGDASEAGERPGEDGREPSTPCTSVLDRRSAAGSARNTVDVAAEGGGWEVVGTDDGICAEVDAAAREVAAEVNSDEVGVLLFDGVWGPCCGAVALFGFNREVCCLVRSFAAARAAARESSCSSSSSSSSSMCEELEWVKGEGIR